MIPVGILLAVTFHFLPLACAGEEDLGCKVEEVLIVTMGWFPAIAAFFVVFAEGRLFNEQAWAYRRAGQVFTRARPQADQLDPQDAHGWRKLVIHLGREALAESAAWLESHRQREISYRA